LVAKAQKVPEEGWTMQDGTPWPGNNVRDHPGMIQVCFDSYELTVHVVGCFMFFPFTVPHKNISIFSTNRFSLVKVVAMTWKEMSCLDWFTFQEKNGQATTIIRRLVL